MNEWFKTPTQRRLAKAAFAALSVVSIGVSGSVFAAEKDTKAESPTALERKPELPKAQQKQARAALARANAQKLVDAEGTTVVSKDTAIDSQYAFFMKFIEGKTTTETFGDGWRKDMPTPDSPNDKRGVAIEVKDIQPGKTGITYHHVSMFGEDIDARFTILNVEKGVNAEGAPLTDGLLAFNTSGQVGAYQNHIKEATYKIEFFKSGTTEPLKVSGFHTFSDIDWTQYIRLDKDTLSHVTGVVADPTSWLYVQDNEDGSRTFSEVNDEGSDDFDVNAMFTILFKDLTEMNVTFGATASANEKVGENEFGYAWFGNTAMTPARFETPAPVKTVSDGDEQDVTNNTLGDPTEKSEFRVTQMIPGQIEAYHYKSLEILDPVIEEFELVGKPKIVDESGEDASNYFEDQSKGNDLRFVAKKEALADPAFYGKAYTIVYSVKVRAGANLDKYLKDGAYHFPNEAQTIVDGKELPAPPTDTVVKDYDKDPQKFNLVDDKETTEAVQAKKGDKVAYAIRNIAPLGAAGKTFKLSDEVYKTTKIDKDSVKVEIAEVTEASAANTTEKDEDVKWTDVTDKGKLAVDEKTGQLTWTLADGSLVAGKQYRLTFEGTLLEDADYSKAEQEGDHYVIPNVATETVGDTEKPTNEVDVLVPEDPAPTPETPKEEPKTPAPTPDKTPETPASSEDTGPKVLPATLPKTGVQDNKEGNAKAFLGLATASVVSVVGWAYFYKKH